MNAGLADAMSFGLGWVLKDGDLMFSWVCDLSIYLWVGQAEGRVMSRYVRTTLERADAILRLKLYITCIVSIIASEHSQTLLPFRRYGSASTYVVLNSRYQHPSLYLDPHSYVVHGSSPPFPGIQRHQQGEKTLTVLKKRNLWVRYS